MSIASSKDLDSKSSNSKSNLTDSLLTQSSLLGRIQIADDTAWEQFVEIYAPLIFGWCRNKLDSHDDASDVTQDVFAKLQKAILRYQRSENSTFRSWLWVVTKNTIRDFARKKQNRVAGQGGTQFQRLIENLPQLDEMDDPTTVQLEQGLIDRALQIVKGDIEPKTWRAFWKVTMENESTQSVASELEMTTNNVRQAKSRVLKRLRDLLEDY